MSDWRRNSPPSAPTSNASATDAVLTADAERLAQAGLAALQRRDPRTAQQHLHRAAEAGINVWLALAEACRQLGDASGEEAAIDGLLAREMRHLQALLIKGNLRARAKDDRAALSFYQTALNVATAMGDVPVVLRPLLEQAQAFTRDSHHRFEQHLQQQLANSGFAAPGGRVGQALDLLLGKTQLFLQEPSMFYFPGLPQRQFYERAEFDWLPEVEAAIPAMQAELHHLLADGGDFDPYVLSNTARPRPNNHLLDDPSWGACYLLKNGSPEPPNVAACPHTMAALAIAPMPMIRARSPMALFSRLMPGTHIRPHCGMINTRLICHIPLLVPDDCALRVGNETRSWRPGEALIFDDSIEHEAWNRSREQRIILLFEIWRPELSTDERAALTAIFEAIDVPLSE